MGRHPVPARLKAFARHQIDFNGEVAQHLLDCDACAQVVLQEQTDIPVPDTGRRARGTLDRVEAKSREAAKRRR